MCGLTFSASMGTMIKGYLNHLSCTYNHLTENATKQPCLMELVWLESPQWSLDHTHVHIYIAFNQLRKGCIPILCTTILVTNKQMKVIPSCDTYQVCPRWCQIVGFLTSFCASMFLWIFHSIVVHRLLHSPSRKSWTHAYGMYATSMDFLFEPLWCSPLTHTKSTMENGGLVGFWTCILWP